MFIFDILKEYRALEELMNEVNEETGEFVNSEDDIREYIIKLDQDRDTKLDNIERVKRELNATKFALDEEIKRLQALKKQKDKTIENLTNLQMYLTNGEKIETPLYKFSTRKSKSVCVLDETLLEDKFFKVEKKPILAEIKKAIESAEKNKESFLGAEIIEKISLTVK